MCADRSDDLPLETLFVPLIGRHIAWPEGGALFLRARAGKPLQTHSWPGLVCQQTFAPDARNAQLVLYLWSGRSGGDAKVWQSSLLEAMVAAGQFNEARAAWTRFTAIPGSRDGLFDPEFKAGGPPPFGWMLASGPSGIAEPQDDGRLHILYYGRDDLALASQLMTLRPGRYRLSMDVQMAPPPSKSLSWTVRCQPGSIPIATILMDRSASLGVSFNIPAAGCPAQLLELAGDAPEFPERAEATIGRLRLQRDGGR